MQRRRFLPADAVHPLADAPDARPGPSISDFFACPACTKDSTGPLVPDESIQRATSALDTAKAMADANCGTTFVMDGQRTAGVFTERDLIHEVVREMRDCIAHSDS